MPAYRPAIPSRSMIRLAASSVPVCAFFFSTCARVDRVINGYLLGSATARDTEIGTRSSLRQSHCCQSAARACKRVRDIVTLLRYDARSSWRVSRYILRLSLWLGRGWEGVLGRWSCYTVRHDGGEMMGSVNGKEKVKKTTSRLRGRPRVQSRLFDRDLRHVMSLSRAIASARKGQ